MTLMLSWSTLGELEGPTTTHEEVQQKEFAYLTTPTMFLSQSIFLLQELDRIEMWFRVLSMKSITKFLEIHLQMFISTMLHVPSVWFLPDPQPLWYQLKVCVHPTGPGSTMVSWWVNTMATTGPRTPALTLILNQFQGQAVTLTPHSFTTPLLTVMAFHVHHMRIIACSHVLYAQSDWAWMCR